MKTSHLKILIRTCIRELLNENIKEFIEYQPNSQPGTYEIIKTALSRVQFDKDMAVRFLNDKSNQFNSVPAKSKAYANAAQVLASLSPTDIRQLVSVVREEEQMEPYDPETDQFAPGPRQRPENWGTSNSPIKLTSTGQTDDWSRPIYTDQNGKIYVDVNLGNGSPSIHTVTGQGEPEYSIKNFTIVSNNTSKTNHPNALCQDVKIQNQS
jgi:hypothetical protein